MKKIYLILIVLITVFVGCTDQFADFNTDKKHPAVVPGEALFSNAQKSLSDYVNNTNVNINIFKLMAQYWTETTYIDEANYDLVTRNISAGIYSRLYLEVLKDLQESSIVITATPVTAPSLEPVKQNKLQIIELMNIYTYSQLVDVFGMVPYSKALNSDNVYPKYDDGYEIYKDLLIRLDNALSKLDAGADSFGSADLYYGGDVASWIKFGNSMKIRMAITIADKDDALAKATVESAVTKCFDANSDDCLMAYSTSSPNYNQLYADLIASGRHDFVPANTIIDAMNTLSDPRRGSYFSPIDTSTVADTVKLAYIGGKYGYSNNFANSAHISDKVQAPNFPGIMLTYSEVCFYLAEAAERQYSVGKTAEGWYNEGITASFDFWGATGAAAYLLTPAVAYTTATGTWKQKIGTQSWIANYTRGLEAYNTWRRLDFPVLNLPQDATDYSDIPVRFTFPVNEQTLNADNYAAAASALGVGGDNIKTKVFWDIY